MLNRLKKPDITLKVIKSSKKQHNLHIPVWLAFTLFLVFQSSQSIAADEKVDPGTVKHVKHTQEYLAAREKYFIDLLALALDKSQASHELQPVYTEPHSEFRGAQYLIRGKFDVYWLNTSERLEQDLIPIRIPLFKGMIGWRLFIIRQADAEKFAKIQSLDELKQHIGLQGYSWPDTQILRRNGFNVDTATDLFSLSRMLERKRGDYFPRAITEAWNEIGTYSEFNFQVDTHLILRYPAAYYFFVRKESKSLAQAIEKGLNIAIDDGSFDEIFWPYFADNIQKTNLNSRLVLSIPNPILPKETPLTDKRLWFTVDDLTKRVQ